MRVLVCGSRDFNSPALLESVLEELYQECAQRDEYPEIIHGNALGADTMADRWARSKGPFMGQIHVYPADWARYGKRAGFIRNEQMLREGRPELVLAFYRGPKPLRSRGTNMMVSIAQWEGVPVREFWS